VCGRWFLSGERATTKGRGTTSPQGGEKRDREWFAAEVGGAGHGPNGWRAWDGVWVESGTETKGLTTAVIKHGEARMAGRGT